MKTKTKHKHHKENKERKWFKIVSKSERILYIVMLFWLFFGFLAVYFKADIVQLAGYFTSLTGFIGTYLYGEYKRTSTSTPFYKKGPTSSRELIIYITIFLWIVAGIYTLYKHLSINNLTVYFSSLIPFVSSFIIYKTFKGIDIPSLMNKNSENKPDVETSKSETVAETNN